MVKRMNGYMALRFGESHFKCNYPEKRLAVILFLSQASATVGVRLAVLSHALGTFNALLCTHMMA